MLPEGFVFDDPISVSVAILTAIFVGLSKGGLGGAMAILGVAVMSLVIPPVQAAAILLPILLVMDFIGLWAWWGNFDWRTIRLMLPGALVGVAVGWLTAAVVSDAAVRLIVGGIAMIYLARWVWAARTGGRPATTHDPKLAAFWSLFAGYGSFVAHSGGPPYQIYTMPLKLPPVIFTGTSTLFFTLVNVAKLPPYIALGQFDAANLITAAVLMPVAAVAVLAGVWIVKRMRMEVFYPFMHAMIFLVACKLLWDGARGL